MHWLLFALLSPIGYGAYYAFSKVSTEKVPPLVGATVAQAVGLVLSILVLLFFMKAQDNFSDQLAVNVRENIGILVLAGVFLAVGHIAAFYAFYKGGSISTVLPIIAIGNQIVGIAIAAILMTSGLSLLKVFGIVLGMISIIFIIRG